MREFAAWWTGIALRLTVLGRGRIAHLWNKYPFFYGQLGCSFLAGCVGLWVFIVVPGYFRGAYWDIELATALTGCGVLIEILRQAFSRNGPASLFGRTARGLVYVTVGLFGILFALSLARKASLAHLVLLERDFRLVQTAVLLSVVAAIFYFGLPIGRNLNGMLVGYGIFIACDLVTLALKSRFPISFAAAWNFLQPFLYSSSLAVYIYALWTYEPGPPPGLLPASKEREATQADNQAPVPFDFGNNASSS